MLDEFKASCGFSDVRKDEYGYFCSVCGERLPDNFYDRVFLSLGPEGLEKLEEQCSK